MSIRIFAIGIALGVAACSAPSPAPSSVATSSSASGDASIAPTLSGAPMPAPTQSNCSLPSSATSLGAMFPSTDAVVIGTIERPGELIASVGAQAWYRYELQETEVLASSPTSLAVQTIQVAGADGHPSVSPGRYLMLLLQPDPAPDGSIDPDLVPAQALTGLMPIANDSVTVRCPNLSGQLEVVGTVPIGTIRAWANEIVTANGNR